MRMLPTVRQQAMTTIKTGMAKLMMDLQKHIRIRLTTHILQPAKKQAM